MLGIVLHLGRHSRDIEVTIKKKNKKPCRCLKTFSIIYVYDMYGNIYNVFDLADTWNCTQTYLTFEHNIEDN